MWQKISIILSVLVVVVGGVIAIEDRYANAQDVKQQLAIIDITHQIKLDTIRYDSLTDQYYNLKEWTKLSPNDAELKEEFKEVKIRRNKLKQRLEQLTYPSE